MESDPIGIDGGTNTYAYVVANPLALIDPKGLTSIAGPVPIVPQFGGSSVAGGKGPRISTIVLGVAAIAAGYAIYQMCQEDDTTKKCSKASAWQLRGAGVDDEHDFKKGFVKGNVSRYDICACEDGSIVLRAAGQCGKSGPTIGTDYNWK